jgi:hypothetical protein
MLPLEARCDGAEHLAQIGANRVSTSVDRDGDQTSNERVLDGRNCPCVPGEPDEGGNGAHFDGFLALR